MIQGCTNNAKTLKLKCKVKVSMFCTILYLDSEPGLVLMTNNYCYIAGAYGINANCKK